MADNFLQAINTGINLGHMADSARMQRAQMEKMAQQMQRENLEFAMKVSEFTDKQTERSRLKTLYAPEQKTISGEMGQSGEIVGGGDEFGVTGPTEQVTMGPGRAFLKDLSPKYYNVLADEFLMGGKPNVVPLMKDDSNKSALKPVYDKDGRVISYAMASPGAAPPEGGSWGEPPKNRDEIKLSNEIEEALAGAYPNFTSDPKARSEAYKKFNSDEKFRKDVQTEATTIAQRRYPISNQFAGQAPGGGGAYTYNPRTNKFELTPIPGGGEIGPKVPGPLPTAVQDNINGQINSWQMLNTMKKYVDGTPNVPVVGKGRQVAAWAGFDKEAQQFEAAWGQYRLSAQSMIKGIPSNYDVQTILDTLPEWGRSKSQNLERIEASRKIIQTLTKNTIAYYKHMNYPLPPEVMVQARAIGVDVKNIQPWNGEGDPLAPPKENAPGSNQPAFDVKLPAGAVPVTNKRTGATGYKLNGVIYDTNGNKVD
jgi:hypothetical protein